MPESNETQHPVNKPRINNVTGSQKVFISCFGIWCATGVANSFIQYKALDKALALATLKAAAEKV